MRMKKKFLFLAFLFVMFSALFLLSACGNKDFNGLSFEDKNVIYDGKAHSLVVEGVPDFATVSYTDNSFTEIGIHEVTATVSADGYNTWEKTAKLNILSADGGVSADGFTFEWNELGKNYKVTGYTGTETIVRVPSTFNGVPVTEVGAMAFAGTGLVSVTLPEGIVRINESAFISCYDLFEVFFPSSLKYVEANAFQLINSCLLFIHDMDAYCRIDFANEYATPLHSGGVLLLNEQFVSGRIVIPEGVEKIAPYAFSGCADVTEFVLPDSVKSIGKFAFVNCKTLTDINIPESVTDLGAYIFYGCDELTGNEYGNAYYLGNEKNPHKVLFSGKSQSITECEIHPDTEFIYSDAFRDYQNLISVTLPDSVRAIGATAFCNCDNLENVSLGKGIESISISAFGGCEQLRSLSIPSLEMWLNIKIDRDGSSGNIFWENMRLIAGGSVVEELVVTENISGIGAYVFSGYKYLTSVTIDADIGEIGERAFAECENLESVSISGRISQIDEHAFLWCYGLKEATVSGVEVIGSGAFYDCFNLETVVFGDGVKIIKENSFLFCGNLHNMVIPSSIQNIEGIIDIDSIHDDFLAYYHGSKTEFEEKVDFDDLNASWYDRIYYYSSSEPPVNDDGTAYDGNYWRYVDGTPTVWVK